jgi:hypothetical protein
MNPIGALIAGITTLIITYGLPKVISIIAGVIGVSVVSYFGLDIIFDYAIDTVLGNYSGLPADIAQWTNYLGVFDAINIIVSSVNASITLKLTLSALSSDKSMKKITFTK